MIYRILVDYRVYTYFIDGSILLRSPRVLGHPEFEHLLGASFGNLAGVMEECGLKVPDITNPRPP